MSRALGDDAEANGHIDLNGEVTSEQAEGLSNGSAEAAKKKSTGEKVNITARQYYLGAPGVLSGTSSVLEAETYLQVHPTSPKRSASFGSFLPLFLMMQDFAHSVTGKDRLLCCILRSLSQLSSCP